MTVAGMGKAAIPAAGTVSEPFPVEAPAKVSSVDLGLAAVDGAIAALRPTRPVSSTDDAGVEDAAAGPATDPLANPAVESERPSGAGCDGGPGVLSAGPVDVGPGLLLPHAGDAGAVDDGPGLPLPHNGDAGSGLS
jgi:hypothetical protein